MKEINVYKNKSFSELEWNLGDLIALDNTDKEHPWPLLLGYPKQILKGHDKSLQGIKLLYPSQDGDLEKWTFVPNEQMITLWDPIYLNRVKIEVIRDKYPYCDAYIIEKAVSGIENVSDYYDKHHKDLESQVPLFFLLMSKFFEGKYL